jgi:glycosyltransferase involved in cell wall biosynthesis
MTSVAVVIVTHNSGRWLAQTAKSIVEQARPTDRVVVIDDHSTDNTVEIARAAFGGEVEIQPSNAASTSRITRIASNFQQGLRACDDSDVIVLGDHDDIWHPHRIGQQLALLEEHPAVAMVASDGRLIDDEGAPVGGTLRSIFPVAPNFNDLEPGDQMSATLRHSIATGGASALRSSAFADIQIPQGWLHDRWWSLVATAREAMLVDTHVVIDYRVTTDQEVGLDRGTQDRDGLARVSSAATSDGAGAYRKLRDIQTRLLPLATPSTQAELRSTRLMRNLLQRG